MVALWFVKSPRANLALLLFMIVLLLVGALGPSDYALRLFPLACSLISLGVFGRFAVRALEGVGPLAAVTLFATAVPLINSGALVNPPLGRGGQGSTSFAVTEGLARQVATAAKRMRGFRSE